MKLLIFSHFFAPSIGGVENITMSLARGLAERRSQGGTPEFDITLITETPAEAFNDGLLPFRVVRRPKFRMLWRLIRDANILHLAGPALVPLLVGRMLRKPIVIEHHTYQAICPNGRLVHEPDRSVCPGHFQALHFAECLHCQANEMSWLASVRNLLLMFPRYLLTRAVARNIAVTRHVLQRHALPRSAVIYHGIEDLLASSMPPRPAAPARGTISFAYVGRFVSDKGIPILLAASKILANEGCSFSVQLIGDGPERLRLEEVIRRESIERHVQVTGYLTGRALAESLCRVDAVVMPSIWEETAGLSIIEQMMRGRVVIASDIGGLAEIVGDAGLKFAPGDALALAACMRKLLASASLLDELGEKARQRAQLCFTKDRMIEEHAKVYRQIFSGRT